MYSEVNDLINLNPSANKIRTNLLIYVDEELKKSRNQYLKINSEMVSNHKNDDIYVMLEDILYDSSNNKSEVYSVSSCSSNQKFTPSDGKNSSSIKLYSHRFSYDQINMKKKSHKINDKIDDFNSKINRSPSLKKKNLINEINTKSDLKHDVFNAYRKLRKIANDLRNNKSPKNLKLRNNLDAALLKNGLKDNKCKIFSSKNSSNDNSFQTEPVNTAIVFNNLSKPFTKVIYNKDFNENNNNPYKGNLTPIQQLNQEYLVGYNELNPICKRSIEKKYSSPYFKNVKKQVNHFYIKLNKCM